MLKPHKKDRPTKEAKKKYKTPIRYGAICSFCQRGVWDYDTCLNLVCNVCGKVSAGAFT